MLSASSCHAARWASLLKSPGPPADGNADVSLYVGPVVFDHSLYGPFSGPGGVSNVSALGAWGVSQWNNPFPITRTSTVDSPVNTECVASGDYAASWSLSTGSVRICGAKASLNSTMFTPNSSVVQLAQSGGSALACGVEYDLFLSPVDKNYPRYPQNVEQTSLGEELISLDLSLTFHLQYLSVASRCSSMDSQCTSASPDYAYGTIGLPLSNPTSRETIFFQILIFDSRALLSGGSEECAAYNACNNGTDRNNGWYFTKLPTLGVNFGSSFFSRQPCIAAVGDVAAFSFGSELLDTLRGSVRYASDHFGADGNMSNWLLGGLYIGTGLQGDATSTIAVGDIALKVLLA
jgi:hypothetical protein